jgi:outer membrane protein assembly factor BamB
LSSPVIYDNQVWITTAKPDGKDLFAVCVDFQTGKIIYDIKVFSPDEVYGKHTFNTYATPTPCIEKGFVYLSYGSMGTACINTANGSVVWKRSDFKCKHVQGPGASPVIYKNLIILHFEGTDERFIVALDKSNGKLVWRSDRPKEPYEPVKESSRKSYSTPIIINVKGRDMLISAGSAVCSAYDPGTGEEIWRVTDGAEATIAQPFSEKGVVYWYTGYMLTPDGTKYTEILAVNPDGKGDITKSNILWRKKAEPLQLLTPVIKDGLIYTVDSKNTMMCIDAVSGQEVWSDRLRSNYNASAVYSNGNIWFFSVKGEVLVIKAGRKYEIVAQNKMEPEIWATPAFLRNSVILRTTDYLYRIGK